MDFLEYDLTITDEQRELQQAAHKFAGQRYISAPVPPIIPEYL